MCGVPFHSAEGYIAKLVARGYKVAICEQLEDPKLAKGLVKRDVIRVITLAPWWRTPCWTRAATISSALSVMRRVGLACAFGDISTGDLTADRCLPRTGRPCCIFWRTAWPATAPARLSSIPRPWI